MLSDKTKSIGLLYRDIRSIRKIRGTKRIKILKGLIVKRNFDILI